MNTILKKTLAITLLATMAVATFTACGTPATTTDTAEPETTTDTAETTEDEPEPSSEGGEISFWNIGTENPDKDLYAYAIDKFNTENADTGYTIVSTATQNDQYKQKLIVAMSAGEAPDVYTSWSGGPMIEYVESGFAQPVTDLVKEYGIDQKLVEAAVAQGTYNGEIYGLPILNNSVAGVFYNTKIYDELGLTAPATLAELEANCDAMVAAGYVPFALANASQWTGSMYYMYLVARYAGLEPFQEAVAGTGTFESEPFIYAGEKIQEWVDAGYFPEGVNGLDEDAGQSKQMMYTEDAVMQLHGSWMVGSYRDDSEEFYANIDWFPFPAIEGGYEDSSIMVGTIGDTFISFNCTDEKLDAAFQFASYYSDDAWIEMAMDVGKIPPYQGLTFEDPINATIASAIEDASSIQLWYDQYLPNEVAEVHKSESQKLFDHSATPEEVAAAHQEAMSSYLGN